MSVSRPSAIVADAGKAVVHLLPGIKNDPHLSNIPLILLASSDKALEDHRNRGGRIAAYLRKSIRVEEFYWILQSIIEKMQRRNIRIPTHLAAALEDEFAADSGFVSGLSEEGMFFKSLNQDR